MDSCQSSVVSAAVFPSRMSGQRGFLCPRQPMHSMQANVIYCTPVCLTICDMM